MSQPKYVDDMNKDEHRCRASNKYSISVLSHNDSALMVSPYAHSISCFTWQK